MHLLAGMRGTEVLIFYNSIANSMEKKRYIPWPLGSTAPTTTDVKIHVTKISRISVGRVW